MLIKFIDIQNFRKLKKCRIIFSNEKTVIVGANNSGKTSMIDAIKRFLVNEKYFSINDITLSNWENIAIEEKKILSNKEIKRQESNEWAYIMPSLDIWLDVPESDIHHVTDILPSLDWKSGLLGIRLIYEPKDIETFCRDFIDSFKNAESIRNKAKSIANSTKSDKAHDKQDKENESPELNVWPNDLRDYLSRKIKDYFTVNAYILDPEHEKDSGNTYSPQTMPADSAPLDINPFEKLFCINIIEAQRIISNTGKTSDYTNARGLSAQLRQYFNKYIKQDDTPSDRDISAIKAKNEAEKLFNRELEAGFREALNSLEKIGYPGFTDPQIKISAEINTLDTIQHDSAVQYEVGEAITNIPRLPEGYNGLGYQNLISIVFELMSFRDDWLKTTGKAPQIKPLHLVFIEEPEAHLHAQVQQVFIRKAFEFLTKHPMLEKFRNLTTQLIVSTHSSNIAYEVEFSELRYFKRKDSDTTCKVPYTTVIDLSNTFGNDKDTEKFTKRYLKSTHCELFFADAAILVEGTVERMLLPHLINNTLPALREKYIAILEIGGSHAHKLRNLLHKLGIFTLIITDLDPAEPTGRHKSTPANRDKGQITSNNTIKELLKTFLIDELLNKSSDTKICDEIINIRVTYQTPTNIGSVEFTPSTFEDSLVIHNYETFKAVNSPDCASMKKIVECVGTTDVGKLNDELFSIITDNTFKKAEFALEILFSMEVENIVTPNYIEEGLVWLKKQLS